MTDLRFFQPSTRVLLPVELPEHDPISPWLIDFLSPLNVVLAGLYVVKEQTSPEQAREQFSEDAQAELEELTEQFRDNGVDVRNELVFTPDVVESVDRLKDDNEIDVIVTARPVESVENVLAVFTPDIDYDRIIDCVIDLLRHDDATTQLMYTCEEEEQQEEKSVLLDGVKSRLSDGGIEEDRISTKTLVTDEPEEKIVEEAKDFDVVIIDENEERLYDSLLTRSPSHLFVVRS
ncbi:MAG: hypothetical protein ACQEVA_20160, partial [Myxococcota bacterium]